jgi:hypothetical protein
MSRTHPIRSMRSLPILLLAGTLTPLIAQSSNPSPPPAVTLQSMRDRYRPVLIFAPSDTPQLRSQLQILMHDQPQLQQRDIVLVPVLSPGTLDQAFRNSPTISSMSSSDQLAARKHFHIAPDELTVLLIGKDGGEKFRSHQPISAEQLFNLIDAMPMRRQEMRETPH